MNKGILKSLNETMLFINICKVLLTFNNLELKVNKILKSVTTWLHQSYWAECSVVQEIVLTFESMNGILEWGHSNPVMLFIVLYYKCQVVALIWVSGWSCKVWLLKWELLYARTAWTSGLWTKSLSVFIQVKTGYWAVLSNPALLFIKMYKVVKTFNPILPGLFLSFWASRSQKA